MAAPRREAPPPYTLPDVTSSQIVTSSGTARSTCVSSLICWVFNGLMLSIFNSDHVISQRSFFWLESIYIYDFSAKF